MAANRYGRIYHSDYKYINLRFPSADAREAFTEKFNEYHASHEHDGEAPRFENEVASKIGNPESITIQDAHSVSLDGYATYEIKEYHNGDAWTRRYRYKPPTCCVAPIISVNRTFIDSGILERHELSAIFTDMPDEDYQSLLESVKKDGFMDPVIRLLGTEVLDGWHRYRAAKELNLIRNLRFKQWDEKQEGDPVAFVKARNLERRHLSAGQRAQIVVYFNERFGMGRPKSEDKESSSNDELKSREELAKEAGVSTATIDRAVAVEKEGASKAVMSGEKSASEVLKKPEDDIKMLREKVKAEMPLWKQRDKEDCQYESDCIGKASFSMLVSALRDSMHYLEDEDGKIPEGEATAKELKELLRLMKSDTFSFILRVRRELREASETDKDLVESEATPSEVESPEAGRSLNERMDRLRSDLCNNHWLHHYSWEGLDILPFVEAYGVGAGGIIDVMQKEITAAHPKPEPCDPEADTDEAFLEDTSLDDLNLPAMESFLESLLYHVGYVTNTTDRDNLSCVVFDALLSEGESVTEREQLSILLDCAHSIVKEVK